MQNMVFKIKILKLAEDEIDETVSFYEIAINNKFAQANTNK
jgi:hypothetical protein